MSDGRLFIISAPSGAGKTTLAKRLVEDMDSTVLSVSHTTRRMRSGEQHGVDYFFVDRADFETMIAGDEFLEHAEVFGNLYGTSKAEVDRLLRSGRNVLLDIDWQGARMVRRQVPGVQSIFVLPPSRRELEKRLRRRGQDEDSVISARMREAAEEMSHYGEYNHVLVNDDLDLALGDLKSIIYRRADAVRRVTIDIETLIEN